MRTALALAAALSLSLPLGAHAADELAPTTYQSEAWALYDEAFTAAAHGRDDTALMLLAQLQSKAPGSGAALLGAEFARFLEGRHAGSAQGTTAEELRARLAAFRPPAAGAAPSTADAAATGKRYATLSDALHDEQPNNAARAELVLLQTLHGLALGLETCATLATDCSDARRISASLLVGGATGAGLSFLYSRGGVTAGQALAVDSGTAWGAWHAGMINALAAQPNTQLFFSTMMLGQALGLVGGHFAWAGLGLSSGDVSLMNSVGVYAVLAASMFSGAAGINWTGNSMAGVLLAAGDFGLVTGYILGRSFPMSRGRTLLLDAGGLLGGLLGAGIGLMVAPQSNGGYAGALVGGLGGIALAAYGTRDWDAPSVPVQLGVAPMSGGGMQVLVAGRAF